jgi:Flp pilus assembly protein CpaB
MTCYMKYIGLCLLFASTAAAQTPDASDGIRKGYRAVSLVLKDGGASAQTVKPLNRVDLIVSVQEVIGGETNNVTRTAIQNVTVRQSEKHSDGSLIQLEVTPTEAQFLAALTHDAKFALALRPRSDVSYVKGLKDVDSREIKSRLDRSSK